MNGYSSLWERREAYEQRKHQVLEASRLSGTHKIILIRSDWKPEDYAELLEVAAEECNKINNRLDVSTLPKKKTKRDPVFGVDSLSEIDEGASRSLANKELTQKSKRLTKREYLRYVYGPRDE
jgi:hypothetical protein